MSGDYDIADYGIFGDAITTANNTVTSITTSNQTLANCKTQLSDESIFMGPICDSCLEGFENLAKKVTTINENIQTIGNYLEEASQTYQSGDAEANKNILGFSNNKVIVGASSGTSESNADIQQSLENMISTFNNRWGATGSELGYGSLWCTQYAWDVVNSITDKFDGYSLNGAGATMQYFIDGNNDTSFHYNTRNSVNAGENDDYTPKSGDFVFYEWGENKWNGENQDHTGVVVSYGEDSGGAYIETIEGNIRNQEYNRKIYLNENSIIGFGSWY